METCEKTYSEKAALHELTEAQMLALSGGVSFKEWSDVGAAGLVDISEQAWFA